MDSQMSYVEPMQSLGLVSDNAPKAEAELSKLFRMMDPDGSGNLVSESVLAGVFRRAEITGEDTASATKARAILKIRALGVRAKELRREDAEAPRMKEVREKVQEVQRIAPRLAALMQDPFVLEAMRTNEWMAPVEYIAALQRWGTDAGEALKRRHKHLGFDGRLKDGALVLDDAGGRLTATSLRRPPAKEAFILECLEVFTGASKELATSTPTGRFGTFATSIWREATGEQSTLKTALENVFRDLRGNSDRPVVRLLEARLHDKTERE